MTMTMRGSRLTFGRSALRSATLAALAIFVSACSSSSKGPESTGGIDTADAAVFGPPFGASPDLRDGGVFVTGAELRCPTLVCDPRESAQSCSQSRQCVLYQVEPTCELAPFGAQKEGTDCTASNRCSPGLGCFEEVNGQKVCRAICCPGDGTCERKNQVCVGADLVVTDGTSKPTNWGHCAAGPLCDVLHPVDSCGGGKTKACYVISHTGSTQCLAPGTKTLGEACDSWNSCSPGFVCVGPDATSRKCRKLCPLKGENLCPEAQPKCEEQAYSPASSGSGICTGP